ncbi:MAG: DUF2182 domain-containing protein [Candidatus Dormibacteria bacterium]
MLWAMMVPPSVDAIGEVPGWRSRSGFIAAYLVLWTAFGLASFFLDLGIHATVNHSPWLSLHPWVISGAILIVAGAYQLSTAKTSSLAACRRLVHSGGQQASGWRPAFGSGLAYGLRCLGANWALMLLAFALATGSLVVMGILTALMAVEVAGPWSTWLVRLSGYAMVAVAAVVLVGPINGLLWLG